MSEDLPNSAKPLSFVRGGRSEPDAQLQEACVQGQRRILDLIASGTVLPRILQELTIFIESIVTSQMKCSVMVVSESEDSLSAAACPSLPQAVADVVRKGIPIGEGVGSCGTAAFRGQLVITSDIASDDLWTGFREFMLSNGIASAWSSPIKSRAGKVFLFGDEHIFSICPL